MKMESKPMAWGLVAGLYVLIFWLAVWLSGCAAAHTRGVTRDSEARDAFAVRVEMTCQWGRMIGTMKGSGTVIGRNSVLTAEHTTVCPKYFPGLESEGEGRLLAIVVRARDDYPRAAQVARAWRGRDIARLTVDRDFGEVPRPQLAQIDGRLIVTSVSSPRRESNYGLPSTTRDAGCPKAEPVFCSDFEFTAKVTKGNSGGGVYDRDGRLVGVVTGGRFGSSKEETSRDGVGSMIWPIRNEVFE